jgi:tetratricopeptide (TPR) repeat protein
MTMARWFFAVALLTASRGYADHRKETAREHFRTGMAHYTMERYDEAIREFDAGFTIAPDPAFIYNMAQAYRLERRPEEAVKFYRKYLRLSPRAKNRADVEQTIETLIEPAEPVATVAAQTPPPAATPETTRPVEAPVPAPIKIETPTQPPVAPPVLLTPVPDKKSAVPAPRSRWPIWVGVAAGVLVVGVVTAAVVATRSSEPVWTVENAR